MSNYKDWLVKRVHKSWYEILADSSDIREMLMYLSRKYSQHECKYYRNIGNSTTKLCPVIQDILIPFEKNLDECIGLMINNQPPPDDEYVGQAFGRGSLVDYSHVDEKHIEHYLFSNDIMHKGTFSASVFSARNNILMLNMLLTNDTLQLDNIHEDWRDIMTQVLLRIEDRFGGSLPFCTFNVELPEITDSTVYYMPDYNDSDKFIRNPALKNFLNDIGRYYKLNYD